MTHDYKTSLEWFNRANWDERTPEVQTIRHCLEHYEKMRWQPIESAPEDGSYFVAWCTQVGCQDIKTRPLVTRIIDGMFEGLMFYDDPTHWMPLPNPPEEKP